MKIYLYVIMARLAKGQDKIDTTVTLLLIVRSYSHCPKFFIVVRWGVVDVKAVYCTGVAIILRARFPYPLPKRTI